MVAKKETGITPVSRVKKVTKERNLEGSVLLGLFTLSDVIDYQLEVVGMFAHGGRELINLALSELALADTLFEHSRHGILNVFLQVLLRDTLSLGDISQFLAGFDIAGELV